MQLEVKTMYYLEVNDDNGKWWFLTDDEDKAKREDPSYRIATEEDLDDAAAMGWKYDTFIIHTSDGDYVWYEQSYRDLFRDNDTYEWGYKRVDLEEEFDWSEEKSPMLQSHAST